MIIACLACQTRYLVPAAHFAAGPRMVRCAHCGHTWLAELPPETGTARTDQLSALAAADTGKAPPAYQLPVAPKEKPFWQKDWFLASVAVIAACILLWMAVDRREIAQKYPSMEAVYDRVGLHIYHAGEGLELQDVRSEMKFDGGTMQLSVEGKIHNKTDKPQSIPNLLAAAAGPSGAVMQSWQIDAPAATLAPGETKTFTSEIRAPQGTVANINLHFVEPDNGP